MRALITSHIDILPNANGAAQISVYGTKASFALARLPEPEFKADSPEHADCVKIQVTAFSLNYRDRSWIADRARRSELDITERAIGSEFCGVVQSVGAAVDDLAPGDRVMADMSWPVSGALGVLPGVPTNSASREIQVHHRSKLIRVPTEMDDATAAAFALCGQTACALVRRAEIRAGDPVLVTAATSNTSLMAIQVLAATGARVHALTSSLGVEAHLVELGCDRVFHTREITEGQSTLRREVGRIGGYRAIIDPFADVYIAFCAEALGFFGRYVTCGVLDQDTGKSQDISLNKLLNLLIVKNLTIRGNCLGLKADLDEALALWSQGRLRPIVAAVHGDVADYCDEAFSKDRVGKVVFRYEPHRADPARSNDAALIL